MNRLIAEITKQMPLVSRRGYWMANWATANAVLAGLTEAEANEFMLEAIPLLTTSEEDADGRKAYDWADTICRLISESGTDTPIYSLVQEDTLQQFVEELLDSPNTYVNHILPVLANFKNLQLETLEQIFDHDPILKKDENGNEDYREKNRRRLEPSAIRQLSEHPSVTLEWMESRAGERARGFSGKLAQNTQNPAVLLKLAHVIEKLDCDYYTADKIVENSIVTQELLEEIAETSEQMAAVVIASRKCKKELLAKLAKTATGSAARQLLSSGKTEPETLEALVDANSDPDVLVGIAQNRSKKVPVSAVMKAFAKIPDNNYWIKQKFIKRADLGRALADLVRKATGVNPAPEEVEEDIG